MFKIIKSTLGCVAVGDVTSVGSHGAFGVFGAVKKAGEVGHGVFRHGLVDVVWVWGC